MKKILGYLRVAREVSRMFPEGCTTGNELDWVFKGSCPACIAAPLEHMSLLEYRRKYPPRNKLAIGRVTINLCDEHLEQLCCRMEQLRKRR